MFELDLSGLISLVVFFWSALVFFVVGIICVLIANFRGPAKSGGVKNHAAFGFFVTAAILMVLDLAACGTMWYLLDSGFDAAYAKLDEFAIYIWIPLQIVIWPAAAFIYNRLRK
jgi:hypothetical protein